MTASFDSAAAHRFFAANCFNQAWNLIDKADRTEEENEQLVLLAQASLWHWTQRTDCTPRNLSIGYWQLSRIFALLGRGPEAARAGQRSLGYAEGEPPFYIAYAHESLARAAKVAGDRAACTRHLQDAQRLATQVEDDGERSALQTDLDSLGE